MSGLLNGTGIDLSGLLNGTSIDLSGLLNGTGISFNGTSIDLSGLLNGTGISFNGTSIDLSGLFNGTGIDLSKFLNGTNGTFDISGLIDFIFGGKESINSTDLTTYYAKTTTYSVTVMKGDKPVTSGDVVFTVDNNEYVAHIGSDGVATLEVNLKPGKHYITSQYAQTVAKNLITVKKSIKTKNIKVKSKKGGKFKVKVLDSEGKAAAKQKVKIKFKGKTHKIKTNKKGIATFKIPKKLKAGKYLIKTACNGLTLKNKVTVKK